MTDLYPPWHPYWNAVMDGYAAGVQHGIEMGRAQIEAEEHPIWAQIIANVNRGAADLARRAGPLGHTEREAWLRQRAEERTQHPGWSIEQIREHAHQSWGLPYPPAPQPPAQQQPSGRQSRRTGPGPRGEQSRTTHPGGGQGRNRPAEGEEVVGVAGKEPSAEARPPLGAVLIPGIPEETHSQQRHRPGHGTTPRRRPATSTPEKARRRA